MSQNRAHLRNLSGGQPKEAAQIDLPKLPLRVDGAGAQIAAAGDGRENSISSKRRGDILMEVLQERRGTTSETSRAKSMALAFPSRERAL